MALAAQDYKKLVKALRRCQFGLGMCAECPYYGHKGKWNGEDLSDCDDKMHLDAADAIEELQAEVKQSAKRNAELHAELEKWVSAAEELQAEVYTLKQTDSKRCQECLYLGQPVGEQMLPKHGEWIPMTVSSGRDSWKCSVCGRRARGKLENLPYCHCGAKMGVQE